MSKIALLSQETIDKIAAGEVIERPASVVKEMVENSIDAGATKITVEIKNGGISYIRVSDNGKGFLPDDMEIAFERHATSKIRQATDLEIVKTMGFRGEALASIAAIANVEMVSRTKDSNIGHRIVVEGGKTLEQGEIGAPLGTTITVKNLFYNTPVRYKFLKKDYTESGYIEDAITRLALVHKEIAFKLINTGKTVIQTTGNNDEKSVIYSIYGKDVAEAIIESDYEYEGIKVTGVVGKPEIARSNRSNQLFFVNGRYIKDKTLTAAAEQAFKGMIPINKYGFLILNLQMDPALVDVNVHPAKLEVRFEEENKVFKSVYYAVKEALSKRELVADAVEEKAIPKQEIAQEIATPIQPKQLTENLQKEADEVEKVIKEDEKTEKSGVFGFLRKNKHVEKGQDEKENMLEEIYKFRRGLKEIGVAEVTPNVYTPIVSERKDEPVKEVADNVVQVGQEVQEDAKSSVPSEEKVQEATEELIKQRQSDEILEEAIKNSKAENPLNKEQDNISENTDKTEKFDTMYSKIFGEKANFSSQPTDSKELSENEKKVLDEIKNTVRPTFESEISEENIQAPMSEENTEQIEEFKNMAGKNYKFIGIVFSTYIIVEIENEMYIIDQHAAHERIMYEKVKKNYYSTTDKDSQLMLLPDIINLTHKEAETIKENLEMFEQAGFTLEAFGENTIKLTGVPNICMDMNTKQLFLDLLDEVDNYSRTDRQDKEERFIATIACKSAVKANMKLTEKEVDKLMERLLALPNPFTCPHGRPTAIRMSRYDIERKFARK